MSKNRTNDRGRVQAECQGYKIRKMVEKKTNPKKEQWPKLILDKGHYGIYAGKNLKKDGFKTVELALEYCREHYNKN
jgi:hypothetical protein